MQQIDIKNPFNAPVYHENTVVSTMDISRSLALQDEPHGTVIIADFQEAGRGRVKDRSWETEREESLLFTILLRYPNFACLPPALTLRTGLATALAVEDFAPALANMVMIKWPNDILVTNSAFPHLRENKFGIKAKKIAGILTEADGGNVHIGIGVNVSQKQFPDGLQEKAVSISLAAGTDIEKGGRFSLLEKILLRLHEEIETPGAAGSVPPQWQRRIEERLYKKGGRVCFTQGAVGSGKTVSGILAGIGLGGELLIIPDGETEPKSFVSGEVNFFDH